MPMIPEALKSALRDSVTRLYSLLRQAGAVMMELDEFLKQLGATERVVLELPLPWGDRARVGVCAEHGAPYTHVLSVDLELREYTGVDGLERALELDITAELMSLWDCVRERRLAVSTGQIMTLTQRYILETIVNPFFDIRPIMAEISDYYQICVVSPLQSGRKDRAGIAVVESSKGQHVVMLSARESPMMASIATVPMMVDRSFIRALVSSAMRHVLAVLLSRFR